MKPDQRLEPRKTLRTQGMLTLEGNPPIKIHTFDIAPGGMSIGSDRQLATGQRCLVNFDIFLSGRKRKVAVVAKTIYSICTREGFKAGLQFLEIDEPGAAAVAEFMK